MRTRVRFVWILLMCVATGFSVAAASGQESNDEGQQTDKSEKDRKSARIDVPPEDRARALEFATQHHPELARLLEQLEKPKPGEFARGIRELNVQIQRLEKLREKLPARYEEQLASWKQDSQIRVLLARWSRNRSPELESQIRELLARRHEARIARLKSDRQRIEGQLKKVDDELASMAASTDEQVDREWKAMQSKAAPARKTAESDKSTKDGSQPDSPDAKRSGRGEPDSASAEQQ